MSDWIFRDAPDVLAVLKGRLREGGEIARGFAFVPAGVVIDQHFLKRGRIGRLLPLLASRQLPLGLGVEEDSAAIVAEDGFEALGARGVVLLDLRDAKTEGRAPGEPFAARGVRISYLAGGDRYEWATHRLHPAKPESARLVAAPARAADPPAFYADVLADGVLYTAMAGLVDSARQQALGLAFTALAAPDDPAPDLAFEWRLSKAADTAAWLPGPTGARDLSIANLRLDVRPVRLARPLTTPWLP
jgi:cyanophycinase